MGEADTAARVVCTECGKPGATKPSLHGQELAPICAECLLSWLEGLAERARAATKSPVVELAEMRSALTRAMVALDEVRAAKHSAEAERDEARAEVERLREEVERWQRRYTRNTAGAICEAADVDALRARVERLARVARDADDYRGATVAEGLRAVACADALDASLDALQPGDIEPIHLDAFGRWAAGGTLLEVGREVGRSRELVRRYVARVWVAYADTWAAWDGGAVPLRLIAGLLRAGAQVERRRRSGVRRG